MNGDYYAPDDSNTGTRHTVCIADVETGGLKKKHPTIQIASICVDAETFAEIDFEEAKLIFDPKACDRKALEMNCYDENVWAVEAIPPEHARDRLDGFFRRHADYKLISKAGKPYATVKLFAHNAPFDMARLQSLWDGAYTPFCWWYPIDTLQLSLWYFSSAYETKDRPENYRLGTLCEWFGIEVGEGAHDALHDCRLVAKLLKKLNRLDEGPEMQESIADIQDTLGGGR